MIVMFYQILYGSRKIISVLALKPYFKIEMLLVFLFGLTGGSMLMLTGNSFNYWLAKLGVDLKTLGLVSLIALPYTLKYFIAPFLDRFHPLGFCNGLSRRKSWLLIFAILILIFCTILGNLDPVHNIYQCVVIGLLFSFSAVCCDIILDSYRVDISNESADYGHVSSMFVFGYKIGMLVSGAGAILMSVTFSWSVIYLLFAAIIFVLLSLFILIVDEDKITVKQHKNEILSLRKIFLEPIKQFTTKKSLIIVVSFIFLYKISDQFILSMINPFLLSLNYNECEISVVAKTFGFIASIVGSLLGGGLIKKYGIKSCLLYFALTHTLSNFLFIAQYQMGYNIWMLYLLTGFGTLTGGMTMSVYLAYIMSICGGKYTGTGYAFFSSLMGLSRVVLPSSSGFIVSLVGWDGFFVFILLISLPGILLIKYLPKNV